MSRRLKYSVKRELTKPSFQSDFKKAQSDPGFQAELKQARIAAGPGKPVQEEQVYAYWAARQNKKKLSDQYNKAFAGGPITPDIDPRHVKNVQKVLSIRDANAARQAALAANTHQRMQQVKALPSPSQSAQNAQQERMQAFLNDMRQQAEQEYASAVQSGNWMAVQKVAQKYKRYGFDLAGSTPLAPPAV